MVFEWSVKDHRNVVWILYRSTKYVHLPGRKLGWLIIRLHWQQRSQTHPIIRASLKKCGMNHTVRIAVIRNPVLGRRNHNDGTESIHFGQLGERADDHVDQV